MARGRMIDNCISISEKINDLTVKEAFVYTWIIPHLDDWGRISGSPRTLKALVFPMKKEISINYIELALIKFKQLGLFLWETIDNMQVLQQPFEEFNNHQHISEIKRTKSKYPEVLSTSPESPGIPPNPPGIPVQFNLIKENLIKVNLIEEKETLKEKEEVYTPKEKYNYWQGMEAERKHLSVKEKRSDVIPEAINNGILKILK